MSKESELAERYVHVWHVEEPAERRSAIEALWAPGGEHFVRARQVRGYDELEERVAGSHEKNVRDGNFRFRAVGDVRALHDVVTFNWEMYAAVGGQVESTGFEILRIAADGRILCDYQFVLT